MIGQRIGKSSLTLTSRLHFGYGNARTEYLLGDEVVTVTDEKEKDLGVPDTEV